jgi:hypothetical protein
VAQLIVSYPVVLGDAARMLRHWLSYFGDPELGPQVQAVVEELAELPAASADAGVQVFPLPS